MLVVKYVLWIIVIRFTSRDQLKVPGKLIWVGLLTVTNQKAEVKCVDFGKPLNPFPI